MRLIINQDTLSGRPGYHVPGSRSTTLHRREKSQGLSSCDDLSCVRLGRSSSSLGFLPTNPLRHLHFSICHLRLASFNSRKLSDRRAWRVARGVTKSPPILRRQAGRRTGRRTGSHLSFSRVSGPIEAQRAGTDMQPLWTRPPWLPCTVKCTTDLALQGPHISSWAIAGRLGWAGAARYTRQETVCSLSLNYGAPGLCSLRNTKSPQALQRPGNMNNLPAPWVLFIRETGPDWGERGGGSDINKLDLGTGLPANQRPAK